jgi:hypothetical protein
VCLGKYQKITVSPSKFSLIILWHICQNTPHYLKWKVYLFHVKLRSYTLQIYPIFSKFRTLTGMPPSHLTRRPAAVFLKVVVPRRPPVRPASPAALYLCLGVAPPLRTPGCTHESPCAGPHCCWRPWTTACPGAWRVTLVSPLIPYTIRCELVVL